MQLTSPSRRALGVLAVSTIGLTTAVVGIPGVAQAVVPTWSASGSGDTSPVPAGICWIEWSVIGGGAGLDSNEEPGYEAGYVVAQIEAEVGEVYTLNPGTAGGDAATDASTAGAGGTSDDPDTGMQGEDGIIDGSVAGGGGGAASTVLLGTDLVVLAYGADAWDGDGVGGLGGGGGTNWAPGEGWMDDYDESGLDGEITAEGIPCMPGTPQLNTVLGLDGALRLQFASGEAGDLPTTGYEYTLDGGATWTALTVQDDFGLLSAVISGLTNGTEYTVQIRAVGAPGSAPSYGSDEVTGTPFKKATAPGNVEVATGDGTVTVSWTAATAGTYPIQGYGVDTRWTNPDGQGGDGAQLCETAAAVSSCTVELMPGKKHDLFVYALDSKMNQGEEVKVTTGVLPAPTSVPESDGTLTLPAGSSASVLAGKTITVSGSGYMANSTVTLLIYSTPQILTTVVTDSTGSFTVTVTVPAGLTPGQHTLVASGMDPHGHLRYLTLPVTVAAGLAYTGTDVTVPAIGGVAALTVGTGLLVLSRRRRPSAEPVAG